MTDKHTPTIKKGAERRGGAALVWFLCSCGDSGSAQKTQAKAIEDFQAHVDKSEAAERLERIRAAAPELLEALEEGQVTVGKALTMIEALSSETAGQQHRDARKAAFTLGAFLSKARDAIKAAKGDA